MRPIKFNNEQLAKMMEYYNLGDREEKIAQKMERHKRVIIRHLQEFGLPIGSDRKFPDGWGPEGKVVFTADETIKIAKMYNGGNIIGEIAEVLDTSVDIIDRELQKLELPPKIGRYKKLEFTPQQINRMVTMYHDGIDIGTIRKAMNVYKGGIERVFTDLNMPTDHTRVFPENKRKLGVRLEFDDQQIKKITKLYNDGQSLLQISKQLNVATTVIQRVLEELNLPLGDNRVFPNGRRAPGIKNNISQEQYEDIARLYFYGNGPEKIGKILGMGRDIIRRAVKELGLPKWKPFYTRSEQERMLHKKIQSNVSRAIRFGITENGGNKGGKSCLNYLPYTIPELKEHLTGLFKHIDSLGSNGEVWMTWKNYGNYRTKTWNDNDVSTWKWNIDHITPQASLPYISMEEENFQKCWALENLRPYSAKQNNLDGDRRIDTKSE